MMCDDSFNRKAVPLTFVLIQNGHRYVLVLVLTKFMKTTYLVAKSLCTKSRDSKYFIPDATWVAINIKHP